MNLAALRAAVVEALDADGAVRVYGHYPRTVSPPAVVVELPEAVDYRATACLDVVTLPLRLFTSMNADGETELLDLASGDGLLELLRKGLGDLSAESRNFGAVNVAGADLYTCQIVLTLTR